MSIVDRDNCERFKDGVGFTVNVYTFVGGKGRQLGGRISVD